MKKIVESVNLAEISRNDSPVSSKSRDSSDLVGSKEAANA